MTASWMTLKKLKKQVLGKIRAHSSTIEWQKRGLTHLHNLFIMEDECKPRTPEFIDRVISCEIPNRNENPILHQAITANNIHGPCCTANMQCPCMEGVGQDCHCTKGYPKAFRNNTIAGDNSYPEYRHRSSEDGGLPHNLRMKNNTQYNVENKWVVPYNPFLSLKYSAHINVEMVNSVEAIKYLYKYITKGHDKVTFTVEGEGQEQAVHDEIETFLHARYISASEAYWQIYQFPLQSRKPPVEKLPCHFSRRSGYPVPRGT